MNRFTKAIANKRAEESAKNVNTPQPKSTAEPQNTKVVSHSNKQNDTLNGIFDELSATKKQGRNTTVYLTNDVLEMVKRIATEKNTSASKVIDTTLRQVLIVGRGE